MEVGSRGAAVLGSSFLVLSWPQAHSPLKLELATRTAASPERADEGFRMNDEGYSRCAAVLGSWFFVGRRRLVIHLGDPGGLACKKKNSR